MQVKKRLDNEEMFTKRKISGRWGKMAMEMKVEVEIGMCYDVKCGW